MNFVVDVSDRILFLIPRVTYFVDARHSLVTVCVLFDQFLLIRHAIILFFLIW
jgi:hypothetical protein